MKKVGVFRLIETSVLVILSITIGIMSWMNVDSSQDIRMKFFYFGMGIIEILCVMICDAIALHLIPLLFGKKDI